MISNPLNTLGGTRIYDLTVVTSALDHYATSHLINDYKQTLTMKLSYHGHYNRTFNHINLIVAQW